VGAREGLAVFIYGLAPSDASAAIGGVTGGEERLHRARGLGKRPMTASAPKKMNEGTSPLAMKRTIAHNATPVRKGWRVTRTMPAGGRGHARGHHGLQAAQGLQAASASNGRARRSQGKSHFIERASCPNLAGTASSQQARSTSRFSISTRKSPIGPIKYFFASITLRLPRPYQYTRTPFRHASSPYLGVH
jgi:hypothetical protein